MAESNLLQKWISGCISECENNFVIQENATNEIHLSNFYTLNQNGSAIANSSYLNFQINTPTSDITTVVIKQINVNMSGGLCELLLLESPTTFVSGNINLIFANRNFNSTKVQNFISYSNPDGACLTSTATSTQCTKKAYFYFSSTGSAQSRGTMPENSITYEIVLKYNTTYIWKLTNLSGGNSYGSFRIHLYENNNF